MNAEPPTDAIARAFVEARQAGAALSAYPGHIPESLDQAYRIQKQAIRLFGGDVAGWKVGRIPDVLVPTFGSNRLAGPIFAASVVEPDGAAPVMPVFGDGFAAAEAEYLLRVARAPDLDKGEWTNAEAADFVDELRVGIEIASSPFTGINAHGPAVTISDFGNNNGLVIGAQLARDSDFMHWPVALRIDGEAAGTGTADTMLDGPFGAVRFLFELAARRRVTIAPGQWISTGAVTGVHQVRPGSRVEARFGSAHSVHCTIGAIRHNG